jgi:hypothetical protein
VSLNTVRAGLLTLAVSVALTLGALELATRWLFAGLGTTGDSWSYFSLEWRRDHEGGLNELGFREREILPKAKDVTRIAVIGDSFTYGLGILREERLTERVDAGLGQGFEILNFGWPGNDYPEHIVNLETALAVADPDLVVLAWFYNDVGAPGVPTPDLANLAGPLHRYVYRRSALYVLANRGFKQLQQGLGFEHPYHADIATFHDPEGAPALGARARLEQFLDLAAAADVPAGIVLWPAVSEDSRAADLLRDEPLFAQVFDVCAARGLPCLDLRPAMREVPADQSLVVSQYDAHPNALANEVATQAVLAWLPEWLETAPSVIVPHRP